MTLNNILKYRLKIPKRHLNKSKLELELGRPFVLDYCTRPRACNSTLFAKLNETRHVIVVLGLRLSLTFAVLLLPPKARNGCGTDLWSVIRSISSSAPQHLHSMVSRHVVELCTSPTSLTAALAKDPCQPVSRIVKQLSKNRGTEFKEHTSTPPSEEADELDLVAKCGSFPHRPSDLFLRVRCSGRSFFRTSHNVP